MLALYNIGHTIEGALGSKAFMAVYLGSAVGGNLTSQLMGNPFVSSMGASGGVISDWVTPRGRGLRPGLRVFAEGLGFAGGWEADQVNGDSGLSYNSHTSRRFSILTRVLTAAAAVAVLACWCNLCL